MQSPNELHMFLVSRCSFLSCCLSNSSWKLDVFRQLGVAVAEENYTEATRWLSC